MSINIPGHFSTQFSANLEMLLQQKPSKLEQYVTIGHYKGEAGSPVNQLGAVEMQEVLSRFAPMGRVDVANDRRWVYPKDWDLPQLIDTFDLLRTVVDPKSAYVQNAHFAANRTKDTTILSAALGDAKTGVAGATTTIFPASQVVAVTEGSTGNSGLNVAKLMAARQKLRAAEVDLDMEKLVMVISAEEEVDLMREATVISSDYNGGRPVLTDGKLSHFMGFDFIHSERLPVDGSGYRRVVAWAKSGMHLGKWNDLTTSISTRNDLQGEPWQVYAKMTIGATRIEEKKVVEIKCA